MAGRLWWLIHKDLVIEYRSRLAWTTMLVLGILVAVLFSLQIDVPSQHRVGASAIFVWMAILFAGMVVIERSCASERHDGCWEGLMLYPLPASCIFLAKFAVNLIGLLALESVVLPLFVVLADVPLLQNPWVLILTAMLASAGLAAVGTLVSALTSGLHQKGALMSVLVLPLVLPVVLAASETTRLIGEGDTGNLWMRWILFLGCFATVFVTLGMTLFGFLVEE